MSSGSAGQQGATLAVVAEAAFRFLDRLGRDQAAALHDLRAALERRDLKGAEEALARLEQLVPVAA